MTPCHVDRHGYVTHTDKGMSPTRTALTVNVNSHWEPKFIRAVNPSNDTLLSYIPLRSLNRVHPPFNPPSPEIASLRPHKFAVARRHPAVDTFSYHLISYGQPTLGQERTGRNG